MVVAIFFLYNSKKNIISLIDAYVLQEYIIVYKYSSRSYFATVIHAICLLIRENFLYNMLFKKNR